VIVTRAIDGDTICVRLPDETQETTVHLLGVDAPEFPASHWSEEAAKYTSARTLGRTVTLRVDPIGWRNDRGELLAYVFITDADNLNLDVIRDGQAYVDRRTSHSLHTPMEVAEKEARLKKRGLWKDLTDEQMPAWRRSWLKSRRY
jgi:endonuclease YncB( thermonuclease family)